MDWEGAVEWYYDNVAPIWIIAGVAALAGALLFWGGSATINAIVDHPLDGCLSTAGYVNRNAPPRCFAPTMNPVENVAEVPTANQPKKILAEPVYDPPCGPNSDQHYCTAPTLSKSLIKGTIEVVTLYADTIQTSTAAGSPPSADDHLQPDYTEVEYDPCGSDECRNEKVKFCGNVLDQFTPGKKLSMVLNSSKMSDYNDCYDVSVTERTFGGKRIKTVKAQHATVPGSVKDLPECQSGDGGTCG